MRSIIDLSRGAALVLRVSFRASPWLTVVGLLLLPAAQALTILGGLWLRLLVNGVLAHDATQTVLGSALMAFSGGAAFLAMGAGYQIRTRISELAGVEFERQLAEITAGIPTIEHHERPEYLDRLRLLQENVDRLRDSVGGIFAVLASLASAAAALVLLGRLYPALLLLPVFWFPRQLADAAVLRWIGKVWETDAENLRALDHLEALATKPGPAKEVLLSGLQEEILSRHEQAVQRVARPRRDAHWRGTRAQLATSLFAALGYAGAVALVALRASLGEATVGDVLMALFVVAQVGNAFSGVAFGSMRLQFTMRSVGDLSWLISYARGVVNTPGTEHPPARLHRGVSVSHLSFRYPGTDRWVLRDVDLELPAGSVVALVGENGAGKTSLIKLLCRFYEPTDGVVSVDGVDIRSFSYGDWRLRLATGFQDFVHFELLARETVGVGDLPRIEDVTAVDSAVRRASAEQVVTGLEDGLETQLGRSWGGIDLSGGQWQRLALARALMRERPLLLILDEPTAALDAPTEHALFERFAGAAREGSASGTVTLLVSHRFSTVRMADLIVVLDDGQVAELGSHAELVRAGGLYAELYELQARAYR
ncbi:MAG TPA: ABC transporter ATP-binding protein [Candidatus Dormibacteraeota bacterium]|jgi:ATP-binding cassette subfamily B protein|nr:ABC transporter ATP-binding protein [Candidatus Dormibacteraeota bacterium]